MTPGDKKKIDQLKKDLGRLQTEILEGTKRKIEEWDELGSEVQISLFENAKESVYETQVDRDRAAEKNKKYLKGPMARAAAARQHLGRIAQLMEECRAKSPNASDATLRRSANKRYAVERKEAGDRGIGEVFYNDDKDLREKLKEFQRKK